MNTLNKLQAHLATGVKKITAGFYYKEQAKAVICADGVTLSVQANENHYCTPRENTGPYTEVEVWCIRNCTSPVTEFDYDESDPSGYVPIEQVVAFIDNHGGFKE